MRATELKEGITHILVDGEPSQKISLLEVILISFIIVSKEGYGVGHHPDVSSSTVVVGFVPLPVLVAHRQDLLLLHHRVAGVEDLLVET